jgi:hypothetical protein
MPLKTQMKSRLFSEQSFSTVSVINRLPAIKILAGSNAKYSSHPLGFLPTARCRPEAAFGPQISDVCFQAMRCIVRLGS